MQDLISRNSSRLEFSVRVIDILALWLAGQLAGLLRFSGPISEQDPIHLILLYFCCGMAFLLFQQLDLYSSWRGRTLPALFRHLALSWGVVLLTGLFFAFLINNASAISRLWLFLWYLTGIVFLALSRTVLYSGLRFLRKRGLNSKNVVIVGFGRTGQEMFQRTSQQHWYGYEVKAIYTGNQHPSTVDISHVDRISALEDVNDYVLKNNIHELWITLPLSASQQLHTLQYLLRNALVDIRWVPDTLSIQIFNSKITNFLGLPAVALNQPAANDVGGIVKDLFDKLFAAVALLLLAPLFIVIAIAIKLSSPGPVFFKQRRLGLNGRPFEMYKFRSMKVHQEHGKVTQATKDDPRITRVGGFLRRTSLDELPQFINVLRGEMSVVGPRPHALQHNEMYKQRLEMYMLRHRVKPGITGWAQVNGFRGETDTDEKMAKRVQFDLHYIEHWSFGMDLKIILWTAFKGWTGKNAY
jgi:putative colanic acid biosynthesis UDP-glucose lipid carrier transferase